VTKEDPDALDAEIDRLVVEIRAITRRIVERTEGVIKLARAYREKWRRPRD